MKKRSLLYFVFIPVCFNIFAQTNIQAEKENLNYISIGTSSESIQYGEIGDEIYSPTGIAVSDKGLLYIFTNIPDDKGFYNLYAYKDNNFMNIRNTNNISLINSISQNGYTMDSLLYFWDDDILTLTDTKII